MARKLEKLLFSVLLFSLPFQSRVFLWSAGRVAGFNEWQSVFVYGTDILVVVLFAFWVNRSKLSVDFLREHRQVVAVVGIFLVALLVSILRAEYVLIAIAPCSTAPATSGTATRANLLFFKVDTT